MKCSKCRAENSDTARFCSQCATPLITSALSVTRTLTKCRASGRKREPTISR
ncbi:MAG: zinc ribbon domain-containing protein [Candidatus Aminicenantes bacterium]|nr:zinc ribbon domain-containing protein [Candidatus Aminicenantes bacterium]